MADLNESMQSTNTELQNVTKSAKETKVALEGVAEAEKKVADNGKDAKDSLGGIDKQTQQITTDFEKLKAGASAALGVLAASVSKTNPLLGQTISMVQKMTPLLADMAKAIKVAGATAKSAILSTGIGAAVIAVTELTTIIGNLISKHKEQKEAAKEAGDAEVKAAEDAKNKWGDFYDNLEKTVKNRGRSSAEIEKDEIDNLIEAYKNTLKLRKLDAEEQKKYNLLLERQKQLEEDIAKSKTGEKSLLDRLAEDTEKAIDEYIIGLNDMIAAETDAYEEIYNSRKAMSQKLEKLGNPISGIGGTDTDKDAAYKSEVATIVEYAQLAAKAGIDLSQWEADEKAKIWEKYYGIKKSQRDADAKAEKMSAQDIISAAASTMTTIGGIFSSLSEITEDDAEKKKAWGIASVIASTAVGIANTWASFMDPKKNAVTPSTYDFVQAGVSTGAILASGIAGVQSIRNQNIADTSISTNVTSSLPTSYQLYTENNNYSDVLNAIKDNTSEVKTTTVLVVDDLNKVQSNVNKVKVTSSF